MQTGLFVNCGSGVLMLSAAQSNMRIEAKKPWREDSSFILSLHLLKVLFPSKLPHLDTLLVHILGLSVLSIRLDLTLDSWIERSQHAGSQKGSIDTIINPHSRDRDT